jgi:hypothetical protein
MKKSIKGNIPKKRREIPNREGSDTVAALSRHIERNGAIPNLNSQLTSIKKLRKSLKESERRRQI